MFVKSSVKPSFVETYEESNKVEFELESINKHFVEPELETFSG